MRFNLILTLTALGLTLGACAAFPDPDARVDTATRNAPYPTLQSLDRLIARAAALNTNGRITPASVASFNGRITNLRDKASSLRAPIINTATRSPMRRGVAVPAAIR